MSNIFELTYQYRQLLFLLEDEEADEQVVKDTLECIEGEIEEKADAYAYIKRQMEADIETIRKEEARLKARREHLEASKARLINNLMECMRATGKTKFKTALNSFGIRKAGGVQPIELDVEPEELPKEFQKVKVSADMDKLRDQLILLSANKDAEFAWAHFKERNEYLSIK